MEAGVRPRRAAPAALRLCLAALLGGGAGAKECRGGQLATCKCVLACGVFGGQEERCTNVEAKDRDEALKDLIEGVIEDTLRNALSDQCDAMKCVVECSKRLACLDAAVQERCRNVNRNIDGCDAECEETTTTTTITVTRTNTTTTTRTSSTTTSTSSATSTTTTSTTLETPWTMWTLWPLLLDHVPDLLTRRWTVCLEAAGCLLATVSMVYGIMRLRRSSGGPDQVRWRLPTTSADIAAHLPLASEDPSAVDPEADAWEARGAAAALVGPVKEHAEVRPWPISQHLSHHDAGARTV